MKLLVYVPTEDERELAKRVASDLISSVCSKLSTKTQKELIAWTLIELLGSFEDSSGYKLAETVIAQRGQA